MAGNSKEKKPQIFETIQKNIATMGFTPNKQKNDRQHLSSVQIICIVKCSYDVIAIGLFALRKANGLGEYMDSAFSLTVEGGITMAFISTIFKNDQLFDMMELISKEITFRSKNNPTSRAIYKKTARLVEKFSKIIYFAAMNLGVPGFVLPKAVVSYFNYFTTDVGRDAFDLPILSCFPFDWKTPYGYLIAVIMESASIFMLVRFMSCLLSLALACFLIVCSNTNDWTCDLQTLHGMAKAKPSETEVSKRLTEFIRSHSNVKHVINDFEDIFEVPIFADFMCCTITLCVVMMMIQVEIISKDVIDPVMLWKSIFYGGWVFGLVFVSCEIGQRLTYGFEEINDLFDQLKWYLLPIKIQRLLPTIMINTQEPIVVGCFGIIYSSRDQFKKVADIVYKSFNLLRRVYN